MPKQTTARSRETEINKPAATIRHGNLKLTLWRNDGDHGPWYVADLVRTFKDESGFHETTKVPADDLLRVAFLAQQAYSRVLELKAEERATRNDGADDFAPS